MLRLLECRDSIEMQIARRRELDLPREMAQELGRSAVEAASSGVFESASGERVDWSREVRAACQAKVSIRPNDPLPEREFPSFQETRVQVVNQTTLESARTLVEAGANPVALNFANGVEPGGGFLLGARAQEEVLCRSSALYQTLVGDLMYAEHRKRNDQASSDWAIYSPAVPVFRADDGSVLERFWLLSFNTFAAPYAYSVGQPEAGDLLQRRIHRVLEIARAYGHTTLVLGAWGCGAFGNDPNRTAKDFRDALENEYAGAFREVTFAIADWSADRRYLGPFRDVFSPGA